MKTAPTNVIPLPSLENHLVHCEERYQSVIYRLDTLDTRMSRMEKMLIEIKDAVTQRQ